jgi:heat shock protein HspQ
MKIEKSAKFAVGTIVHHLRYGYRGVILDIDPTCAAAEEWYRSNRTQPDRDQPWYSVLVHGAAHSTYVAESNLRVDDSQEAVEHPLIDEFFCAFVNGRYQRHSLN